MTMESGSIHDLQQELEIVFKNETYLVEALTHSSSKKHQKNKKLNNERLEFFGDSVLKFIVSEYLLELHPHSTEGELSVLRARIISDRFLAEMAHQIHLGRYIRMSYGEKKSGGQVRKSILANALEALLGACYLDQGMDVAKALFFRLWNKVSHRVDSCEFKDFKTSLQENCQKMKIELPVYRVVREEGPDHNKTFHIEVCVSIDDAILISQGDAATKKEAEQAAAHKIIQTMEHYIRQ